MVRVHVSHGLGACIVICVCVCMLIDVWVTPQRNVQVEERMEQAIRNGEPVAATIVEPIQAEGGIVTDGHFVSSKIGHTPPPPPHTHFSGDKHASPQFFRGIQQICKKVCVVDTRYCNVLLCRRWKCYVAIWEEQAYLIARNVRCLYFAFIFHIYFL